MGHEWDTNGIDDGAYRNYRVTVVAETGIAMTTPILMFALFASLLAAASAQG